MSLVAFIDANVPIYAAGRAHSYKEPCADILGLVAESPLSFVTDAEVLQELVHRYLAQDRWALGREVLRAFALVMQDRLEPVYAGDILVAADLADRHPGISARDLVHVAVMLRLEVEQVVSADTDLDRIPGITRLDPMLVGEWGRSFRVRSGD